jgi:lipopolysaccharide assembly protein A
MLQLQYRTPTTKGSVARVLHPSWISVLYPPPGLPHCRSAIAVKETLMKFFVWLIRVLVFVILLVLALANTQSATLNFLAGYSWQAPLILIGLAFFVVGLVAGLLSSLPSLFRLRMENARLKRELRVARDVPVVPMEPPMPPLI